MRKHLCVSVFVISVAVPQPALARGEAAWGHASSIARDGLILAALGLPAVKGDWKGDLQAAASMGAAGALTLGLKKTFPEMRPDLSDRKGFPSGHTSISFAAAATLQNRYGWEVGIPAQVVAGFVGLARVQARKHRWHDVAVGAVIGEASGFLLTSKHTDGIRILPWGDTQAAGFTLASRF